MNVKSVATEAAKLTQAGDALQGRGDFEQAVASYRQALALLGGFGPAWANMGVALRKLGRLDGAIAAYQRAIEAQPDAPEGHYNLGNALEEKGQLTEAAAALGRAVALRPEFVEAISNLAAVRARQGDLSQALALCERAAVLRPASADAHFNWANALKSAGRFEEAILKYQRAITLRPDHADAWNNLGNVYQKMGQLDQAVAAHRRALELRPSFAEALDNLGGDLKEAAALDEAVDCYRRALQLKPNASTASNLIYLLYFHPAYDAARIWQEHVKWEGQFAGATMPRTARKTGRRDPHRRLRVGYVSPDFYRQAEVHFVLPLLASHDRKEFEVHCYSSVVRADDLTEKVKSCADVWHDVAALSDEALASQVSGDGIDILVDLTMHMARNRLLTFARKPAPVQVTWLVYPGTTGLRTIDYRLTDAWMDPPGMDESIYSERSVRLPHCWCCYDPIDQVTPAAAAPVTQAGMVTFGSLNHFCKVNDEVMRLWCKALVAVENSRLLLLAPQGRHRGRLADLAERSGVDPSRIVFVSPRPRIDYLKLYWQIDIGLDPFPYNGITTTCDAMWMGVPVVTLKGLRAAARAGLSLLSNVGLPELVADSQEQYVQIVRDLARDLDRLQLLHASLRQRMLESPLMNARQFAAQVEIAFRGFPAQF